MSNQKCPQCGLVNFAADTGCKRCGASLINEAAQIPQYQTAPSIPLISCPVCRTQVSSQAASCPKCGQPLGVGFSQAQIPTQNFQAPQAAFVPEKAGDSNPAMKGCLTYVGITLAVLFGFSFTITIFTGIGSHNKGSNSPLPSNSNTVSIITNAANNTPNQTLENNVDYKAGYKAGFNVGVQDAKDLSDSGGGTGLNEATIHGIAMNNVEHIHAFNKQTWVQGYEAGYPKGFEKTANQIAKKK